MSDSVGLQAVVFDYGHTLMDFRPAEDALLTCYEDVLQMLRAEAYEELPAAEDLVEHVSRRIGREIQDSYRRRSLEELDVVVLFERALGGMGLHLPPGLIHRVAVMEHRAMASRMSVPRETLAVLRDLRRRNLRIGLVSNAHFLPEMMREDIERFGVAAYLDDAVFSSEVGVRKPHPDIFRKVLTAMAVSPPAALFVGDRLMDDIGGAQAMGMRTALTTEYRQEVSGTDDIIPDHVITSLEDLLPIVDDLLAAG